MKRIFFILLSFIIVMSCSDNELGDPTAGGDTPLPLPFNPKGDPTPTPVVELNFDNWIMLGTSPYPNDEGYFRIDLMRSLPEDIWVTIEVCQIGDWPTGSNIDYDFDWRDDGSWWDKYEEEINWENVAVIQDLFINLINGMAENTNLYDYFDDVEDIFGVDLKYEIVTGSTKSNLEDEVKTKVKVNTVMGAGVKVSCLPMTKIPAGSNHVGEFICPPPVGYGSQPTYILNIKEISYSGSEKIYIRPVGLKVSFTDLGNLDKVTFVE